jgi:CBS domain-containing protein
VPKDNVPLKDDPSKDPRLVAMRNLVKENDMVVFRDVSVQQIIEHKTSSLLGTVVTVSQTDTVYNAIKKMNATRVGALVVAEEGTPVGMISERDYLNKVILRGFSSKDLRVRGIPMSFLFCKQ